ncbi:MAG: hypothetical protein PHY09_12600 [Desulfuromonadaceae bacterium]|nr:hypothetical protein [Desulfuromonadaceae bacterium]MDD5107380.1 hypothetical protein [Desulfuromonadaceae bacterium]
MQKIPLSFAKSGMILARDVFRGDTPVGMPVCGKGSELTNALITRFEQMDVKSITVEGHPVWEEGDRSLNDYLRELDNRFAKTIQEPHNAVLHCVYKEYLIKAMEGYSGQQPE